jgi:hypothetical protein
MPFSSFVRGTERVGGDDVKVYQLRQLSEPFAHGGPDRSAARVCPCIVADDDLYVAPSETGYVNGDAGLDHDEVRMTLT